MSQFTNSYQLISYILVTQARDYNISVVISILLKAHLAAFTSALSRLLAMFLDFRILMKLSDIARARATSRESVKKRIVDVYMTGLRRIYLFRASTNLFYRCVK